tara:strand:- start:488 stop:784 length:297 start_codon:yes stop_codon:yes gene_type:complete
MNNTSKPWVGVLAPTSQCDIDVDVSDDFMIKFCALYSSNFNSKCLQGFNFDWHNYSGKPIEIKLAQFRLDYKRNQRSNTTQHISSVINQIKQQWKDKD